MVFIYTYNVCIATIIALNLPSSKKSPCSFWPDLKRKIMINNDTSIVFQIPPEVRCFRYGFGDQKFVLTRLFGSLGFQQPCREMSFSSPSIGDTHHTWMSASIRKCPKRNRINTNFNTPEPRKKNTDIPLNPGCLNRDPGNMVYYHPIPIHTRGCMIPLNNQGPLIFLHKAHLQLRFLGVFSKKYVLT